MADGADGTSAVPREAEDLHRYFLWNIVTLMEKR